MLKEGSKAPSFELMSDEGKKVSLKDFAGKKVHPLEALPNRDSTIRSVYHVNERTVISGGESGRGWVLNIHEQTGRMSAAVVTEAEGFVIFGQCAVQ